MALWPAAALALSDHIGRTSVRCEPQGHNRYARVIAVCLSGAEDLNRWMVAIGWAVAYRKYSWTTSPMRSARI